MREAFVHIRQIALVFLALGTGTTNAALLGRMPATPGGTDYQAYYDDAQDITWVADANLAATLPFGVDVFGDRGPGTMTWDRAHEWLAAMNAAAYLGASDWRLPRVTDTDGPDADTLGNDGCDIAYVGTDCGWNVDPATGELANLYYVTLGNIGGFDPNGIHQDCDTGMPAPPACLTNTGPFTNFWPTHFWMGTEFVFDPLIAWEFNARIGSQNVQWKTRNSWAWAVRSGDIGHVVVRPDTDGDGVPDVTDNCTLAPNASQLDADGDGNGNACDGDLNGSGLVTVADVNLLRGVLNEPATASPAAAAADLNGSGLVTAADLNLMRAMLNHPPGPSGPLP